jgi:hypothetical protein
VFTNSKSAIRLIDAVQTLTDLNDFLTPSQACIKPVEQANEPEESKEPGAATVCSRAFMHEDPTHYHVTFRRKL